MSTSLFVFFTFHIVILAMQTGMAGYLFWVQDPMWKMISKKHFQQFQVLNMKRSMQLSLPLTILEVITAIGLLYTSYRTGLYLPSFLSFILMIVIWVISFKQGMKLHQKMMEGFHSMTHQMLVKTHLWRLILWGVRTLGLLFVSWFV